MHLSININCILYINHLTQVLGNFILYSILSYYYEVTILKKRTNKQEVSYAMLRLITRYMEIDKKTQNYGTNVSIHHAEIHMVSAIAENPGIHVRGLAEHFNISSASVSELIRKLEKKNLIRRETDSSNLSRLSLHLTKKGELAHEEHMKYHRMLEEMVEDELNDFTDEQINSYINFFHKLTEKMEGYEDLI